MITSKGTLSLSAAAAALIIWAIMLLTFCCDDIRLPCSIVRVAWRNRTSSRAVWPYRAPGYPVFYPLQSVKAHFNLLKATCTHPYITTARQQTPCSVSCSRVFQNWTHAPSLKRHCSVSPCLLLLHSTLV